MLHANQGNADSIPLGIFCDSYTGTRPLAISHLVTVHFSAGPESDVYCLPSGTQTAPLANLPYIEVKYLVKIDPYMYILRIQYNV